VATSRTPPRARSLKGLPAQQQLRIQPPGRQRHHQDQDDRGGRGDPGPPAPAGRWQRPGRGQQQHQAEQGERRGAGGRVVPGQHMGGGEGAGPGHQPVGHRGGDHPAGGQREGEAEQQPAHRVPGAAAGQHRPDRGRAQHRQHGANQGPAAELGQVGPAGPDRQAIDPGHHGQAEHGQPPQPPRQPGRPPARPAPAGGRRHRRGPGCSQRTTDPATSHARQLPVWPACVSATLRTTDLPSVRACATGSGSSTVHHSSPRVRQQHRLDEQVLDPRAGERKITTSTRQDPALKALVLDVLKVLSPAPDNRRPRARSSPCISLGLPGCRGLLRGVRP
jgi:hypothetical protein